MGGGSGLLAAAEGDVRSRLAPKGLRKVSLEFEKQLALHFFSRLQTQRWMGETAVWVPKKPLNF